MPAYFFRSEPGAVELRRLARRESGRVCQRVLMIANLLEGMEHEEAARLAGLSRSNRMSQSDLDAVDRGIPAIAPRGKGSHETPRWRKPDSNPRSPATLRPFEPRHAIAEIVDGYLRNDEAKAHR
jgi:hypothetical protein